VFAKLNEDFGPFDIDLTADAERRLCPIWFGPDSNVGEEDALKADWAAFGRCGYSNPPYGPFVQWMLKVAAFQAETRGFSSTFLLPMRVTKSFRETILPRASRLLFCDKRITFFERGLPRINPRTGKAAPAMFDSIVVVFDPNRAALHISTWEVPVAAENAA
jgi:hypothetical protein